MTAKKIFVVDDDLKIRTLLKTYLEKNNYEVLATGDGESFLAEFNHIGQQVALVVLDIMLPGQDGFSVCQKLRQMSDVPIIMLTANADETDRIVGLEMGADDYIAKPFSPRELLARIKAIHRRTDTVSSTTITTASLRYFHFRGFILDRVERLLTDPAGECVGLSGGDFQLLEYFLENSGKILDRDALAEYTRGKENSPLDRYLDVQISRLRQRLEYAGEKTQLIKTVRGAGYIFAVEVSLSNEAYVV